jgi:multidrug transporter EmrE-like cation transporter
MSPYWALAVAIAAEVVATTALKATHAFTKPLASTLVIAAYALAFYALSWAIKTIPVGVAYGIWSGLGIVLVSVSAWFFYQQSLSVGQIVGLCLIVAGVIMVNVTT